MNPTPLHTGLLNRDPYHFAYLVATDAGSMGEMARWTLYCVGGTGTVTAGEDTVELEEGAIVQGTGVYLLSGDSAKVFIAGMPGTAGANTATLTSQPYRVSKPWGEELWLTGENNAGYCMKAITVSKGTKTSLQYHERKVETSVLFEGDATLRGEDTNERFPSSTYVNIFPGTIHRIIADTDILLIEASTDDLDDVIRLEDDAGRSNGRIDEEHR